MWHFSKEDNKQEGPVSLEEIQSLIDVGTIRPDTLVWKKGNDNWMRASETDLRELFPADAPPPLPVDIPPPLPKKTSDSNTITRKIEPGRLLRDSLNYASSVYVPMLVFFVPSLVLTLLVNVALLEGALGVTFLLYLCYLFTVPFVSGASIYFVQKNLTQQGVTIGDAMKRAADKFSQLTLVTLMSGLAIGIGLVLLIVPGIYLSVRLTFIYYAVMIENVPAVDALKRSWEITQNLWGQLFLAFLILGLVVGIPAGIVGALVQPIFASFSGGLIGFFIAPVIAIYSVFLFMRVVNFANESAEAQ